MNTDRSDLKRQPFNIQQINQPFNAEGFNFKKVKEEEKLFKIEYEDDIVESMISIVDSHFCFILPCKIF